jgi:hypothetical protein
MLRTARNRMPTPKSCSEHCKEQLCHLVVRKFVYWLASIGPSNTLDQFVGANFTSFRLTKSILLEMAVYNMQFKLVAYYSKKYSRGLPREYYYQDIDCAQDIICGYIRIFWNITEFVIEDSLVKGFSKNIMDYHGDGASKTLLFPLFGEFSY